MGLLGDIFSFGNKAKRNIRGLLDDPMGYTNQVIGMLSDDAKTTSERQKRMVHNPASITVDDVAAAMNSASALAPMGMTVWHGSPHKFSKFDMSKIGTGEGHQMYGHGLYMAESPDVARQYASDLAKYKTEINGQPLTPAHPDFVAGMSIGANGYDGALKQAEDALKSGFVDKVYGQQQVDAIKKLKDAKITQIKDSAFYKVDIPDEAVSRFLDWDKPLSQQAPEARKALEQLISSDELANSAEKLARQQVLLEGMPTPSGREFLDQILSEFRNGNMTFGDFHNMFMNRPEAADILRKNGIPGIRYLDGGSRSAGQGSSNFVLFNDQLPRILETNGVPTGQVPWKPGEWQGLLSP